MSFVYVTANRVITPFDATVHTTAKTLSVHPSTVTVTTTLALRPSIARMVCLGDVQDAVRQIETKVGRTLHAIVKETVWVNRAQPATLPRTGSQLPFDYSAWVPVCTMHLRPTSWNTHGAGALLLCTPGADGGPFCGLVVGTKLCTFQDNKAAVQKIGSTDVTFAANNDAAEQGAEKHTVTLMRVVLDALVEVVRCGGAHWLDDAHALLTQPAPPSPPPPLAISEFIDNLPRFANDADIRVTFAQLKKEEEPFTALLMRVEKASHQLRVSCIDLTTRAGYLPVRLNVQDDEPLILCLAVRGRLAAWDRRPDGVDSARVALSTPSVVPVKHRVWRVVDVDPEKGVCICSSDDANEATGKRKRKCPSAPEGGVWRSLQSAVADIVLHGRCGSLAGSGEGDGSGGGES